MIRTNLSPSLLYRVPYLDPGDPFPLCLPERLSFAVPQYSLFELVAGETKEELHKPLSLFLCLPARVFSFLLHSPILHYSLTTAGYELHI